MAFDQYFDRVARRFNAFYKNERVARLLGRGPMFDRLYRTIEYVQGADVASVLDIGCGAGPLFKPLATKGVAVHGIDPAPAMVSAARAAAQPYGDLVRVEQRTWEDLTPDDRADLAVALGVFDYVDDAAELIKKASSACPRVAASFPAPGLRTDLRKRRYGRNGVKVTGYSMADIKRHAERGGCRVIESRPLGRAGFWVLMERSG